MKKVKLSNLAIIVLAILLGIVICYYLCHITASFQKTSIQTTQQPLYWIDTMEPTVHYPGPGKSHMDMELVPVYAKDDKSQAGTVRISAASLNNLGVRLSPVIKGALSRRIETVGYIEPNENKISHLHIYVDAWIRKLVVKTMGDKVTRDQLLMQLYSPTLINAQEEYLIALDSKNHELVATSSDRLQALGVSERQIQQLKITRKVKPLVDVYSPQNGIIAALNVREGMHVTPETEIMSLSDLSNIWMIAQIYEQQASWVKVGEEAQAKFAAFPGKVWTGIVEYVYPEVDPTTRTLKIRFRFNNSDNLLKPNMYANVMILSEPINNVLSIPLEALIRSSQGNHVIVSLGEGKFTARRVDVGIESDDRIEIISGLKLGEKVMTSGQFFIDSESNLNAGLQRLDSPSQTNKTSAPQKIEGQGMIKP